MLASVIGETKADANIRTVQRASHAKHEWYLSVSRAPNDGLEDDRRIRYVLSGRA